MQLEFTYVKLVDPDSGVSTFKVWLTPELKPDVVYSSRVFQGETLWEAVITLCEDRLEDEA